MSTSELPNYIVLNGNAYEENDIDNPYIHCNEDGTVGRGIQSVFNTAVKIAVEKSTVNSEYVHLRFCNNNTYMQRRDIISDDIIAVSNEKIEDTTNVLCTLFKPDVQGSGTVSFTHVQTGWRMQTIDVTITIKRYVKFDLLEYVDWETLVNVPTNIALMGDNGKYLSASSASPNLQFSSDDPNQTASGYKVTLSPNGYIEISSNYSNGKFYTGSAAPCWVYNNWQAEDGSATVYFWPVKIDDTTIALRSQWPNKFCQRLTQGGVTDCLAASTDTIETTCKFTVQELVAQRKIYNVTYAMESALIYDEAPYLAGTATLTNPNDEEASMEVSITYQNETSYTFSRGVSLTAGVSISVEAEIPLIASTTIETSFSIDSTLDWDTTTTTTTSVTATGTVPVPANSTVTVSYVGTQGTCNLPYTYTQEDVSSTTGAITYYSQTDGVYNGVSCYNFVFQVEPLQPASASA